MSSNAERASSSRPPAPPRRDDAPPDRSAPPTLRESFLFPLATPEARRDLVTGGLTLLLPPLGWVLNMGHRLDVVHRIYHDDPPYYRGFRPWGRTALRGLKALTAILVYLSPGACCAALGYLQRSAPLAGAGALLLLVAVYVLPGGMTFNAAHDDISYLYRPDRAARRALEGGRAYLRAWLVALCAIGLSPIGLLGLGVGFFFTSVWAWMVVGYAFSRALSLRR